MHVKAETSLKLDILTSGLVFSERALACAVKDNAKGQNLVYNAPINAKKTRPQEIFLTAEDGYSTVVSCVAPSDADRAVYLDVDATNKLIAKVDGKIVNGIHIAYVQQPAYYQYRLPNGEMAKKYVSACGYDELNIIPWKGCYISQACKFCGANTIFRKDNSDDLHAFNLSRYQDLWKERKLSYLTNLKLAVECAINDECYHEHMHVIMISGNLADYMLNKQAEIYAEIASEIQPIFNGKSSEGIVAVITPPRSFSHIDLLKQGGIDVVVFNLEVGHEPWFSNYCPGKSHLGFEYLVVPFYI